MLANWTKLLPVFVYVWLARRCERVTVYGMKWHHAAPNILVRAATGDTHGR